MGSITDTFLEHPIAAGFGLIGLLCQLTWPVFRSRRSMLMVQFGVGADYCLHYAFMDAWSGAAVAGLGATQTFIVLMGGERISRKKLGLALLPMVAVIGWFTWSGMPSLFALSAVTLIMTGRLQSNPLHLRLFMMGAAPFGIGYDILVGALPALVGALVSATISASMLIRELKVHRAAAANALAA